MSNIIKDNPATTASVAAGAVAMGAGTANLLNQPSAPGASSGLMDVYKALADTNQFQESMSPGDSEAASLLREQLDNERRNNFKSYLNTPGLSPAMVETLTLANQREQEKMRAEASRAATTDEIEAGLKATEQRLKREGVASQAADAITKANMAARKFESDMRLQQFESFNKIASSVATMMTASMKTDALKRRAEAKAAEEVARAAVPRTLGDFAKSLMAHEAAHTTGDMPTGQKRTPAFSDPSEGLPLRKFATADDTLQVETIDREPVQKYPEPPLKDPNKTQYDEEDFEDLVIEARPVSEIQADIKEMRSVSPAGKLIEIMDTPESEAGIDALMEGKDVDPESRFAKYAKIIEDSRARIAEYDETIKKQSIAFDEIKTKMEALENKIKEQSMKDKTEDKKERRKK